MDADEGDSRSGLEGQEYVTVLSWIIQTYPGKELMGDVSLGIPKSKVKPLLDEATIVRLQEEYLDVRHFILLSLSFSLALRISFLFHFLFLFH